MINKIWSYGTKHPTQRVGVIILAIGIVSAILWMFENDVTLEVFFVSYYFPRSSDLFIYHLYLFFIPIGLLMSWGYGFLLKIKYWVVNGKFKDKAKPKKVSRPHTPPKKNLHFKTTLAAFQFAVPMYLTKFSVNDLNFGIIQDKSELQDGSYHFLVQLADMRTTMIVSGFNDKYADDINVGNLVYWKMTELIDDANPVEIPAVGFVAATLYPEFNPNNKSWKIKKDLTK